MSSDDKPKFFIEATAYPHPTDETRCHVYVFDRSNKRHTFRKLTIPISEVVVDVNEEPSSDGGRKALLRVWATGNRGENPHWVRVLDRQVENYRSYTDIYIYTHEFRTADGELYLGLLPYDSQIE